MWAWVVNAAPRPLYPGKETRYPLSKTLWVASKFLAPKRWHEAGSIYWGRRNIRRHLPDGCNLCTPELNTIQCISKIYFGNTAKTASKDIMYFGFQSSGMWLCIDVMDSVIHEDGSTTVYRNFWNYSRSIISQNPLNLRCQNLKFRKKKDIVSLARSKLYECR
jgi:hypothetical protein